MKPKQTHFGFQSVLWEDKEKKVTELFESVAKRYDLMNTLMSFGVHHYWKRLAIGLSQVRKRQIVLDLAGGSGDLTKLLSRKVGPHGLVILADINKAMLTVGRDKLLDQGYYQNIDYAQVNAECLPFGPNAFDAVTMGFGLRNVTDKSKALASIYRVLKPGGQLILLEFSTPINSILQQGYDWYSFHILPKIGKWVAGNEDGYRYLAESIRMHPNQQNLKEMIEQVGFEGCGYYNFTGGIVALHTAYKY